MLPPARRATWAYCRIEPSELADMGQLLLVSLLRHDHARTPASNVLGRCCGGRCQKWWWTMREVAILAEWRKRKTD